MPRAKKEEITPKPTEEEVYAAGAKLAELPKPETMLIVAESCGHVNNHFMGSDGLPEKLFCSLPAGHEGDHEADYPCLRPLDGSIKQAKEIATGKKVVLEVGGRMERGVWTPSKYIETTERAYWSDGASVPPEKIKPDLAQLAHIKANKGHYLDEAQIIRNPNAL